MWFTTNDKQARPFEIITAFRIDSDFQFVVNTICILEKIDIIRITQLKEMNTNCQPCSMLLNTFNFIITMCITWALYLMTSCEIWTHYSINWLAWKLRFRLISHVHYVALRILQILSQREKFIMIKGMTW